MRLDDTRRTRGDIRDGREGGAGVGFRLVWGKRAGHDVRGRIGGGAGEGGGRAKVVVCGHQQANIGRKGESTGRILTTRILIRLPVLMFTEKFEKSAFRLRLRLLRFTRL